MGADCDESLARTVRPVMNPGGFRAQSTRFHETGDVSGGIRVSCPASRDIPANALILLGPVEWGVL